jgi:tRNA (guanine37-N1)-methyltransferase
MTSITVAALCVKLQKAEKIRKDLLQRNLLRTDLKIRKDDTFIYFPLKKIIKNDDNNSTITDMKFQYYTKTAKSYKDIVQLPKHLKKILPSSYDSIGDIIVIKLSDLLLNYTKEIGDALLKSNKNIKTVCLSQPVRGEYRTRNISVIAGIHKTTTTHKEYNLLFSLDVKDMYFSVRLANERRYIAGCVKDNEVVVDLFAGVAPFSIMIAAYAKPKVVYAFDKNPYAVAYAKKNCTINRVLDCVEVVCIDSKKASEYVKQSADRIIMNLPFSSLDFFSTALGLIKDTAVIHYYDILSKNDVENRFVQLRSIADKLDIHLCFDCLRKIKSYAPREFYIGLDITATKKSVMPM